MRDYVRHAGPGRSGQGTGRTGHAEPAEPSVDELFDALGDGRRRRTLRLLASDGSTRSVRELADELADAAPGVDRLVTSLHHCHLPKLAAAGLVEFDADRGTVRRGRHARLAGPFLELAAIREER